MIPNHPNQVLAIGLFGALRHAPLRSKTLRAIAAGRNDGARDHEHSRPRDDALLDGLLETDICIAGTLGSKVANRCEAGHQRAAQMVRCTCNAQRKSLECILIVPRCLTVRMQQDMRMPFDQARQQRCPGHLDHLRLGRSLDVRCSSRRLDALATHQHHPPLVERRRFAVEDARRFKQIDRRWLLSWSCWNLSPD